MLDRPIHEGILFRLTDADPGVRRDTIREAAGQIRESESIRAALIAVVARDTEADPDTARAAFEIVAGLFGSDREATRAVERSLDSRHPAMRRDAAQLITEAAHAGDAAATRMLARNLTNKADDVRPLLIRGARELIAAGQGAPLKGRLLAQVDSEFATDRVLAADLLEALALAQRDIDARAAESSGAESPGDADADTSAAATAPPAQPRLAESVIWAMVRTLEESHLQQDPDSGDRRPAASRSSPSPDDDDHADGDPGPHGWPPVAGRERRKPLPAVTSATPATPVVPRPPPRPISELLDELVGGLREREIIVLEQRTFAMATPRTLVSLGAEFGVSRERVRQIERRATTKWRKRIAGPDYGPLRVHAARASDRLGWAVPLAHARFSQTADDLCGVLPPERRALALRILLEFKRHTRSGDWLLRLRPSSWDELQTSIQELTEQWPVVPRLELARLLSQHGIVKDHVEAWCTGFAKLRFIKAGALPKGSSRDDMARVLLHRGEPASAAQLLAEAGLAHLNARAARHEAIKDPRFTRINRRGHLAHRDWGLHEFTHITDGLIEELERRGGSAPIDDLCRELAERYRVSRASVRSRTAAPLFMRTASGMLTLRPADVPFEFDTDPATSPVCFRHDDHWSLRMLVTANLLRGSGREVPAQFAGPLGCRPGGRVEVASAWGSVSLAWAEASPKPAMGSLRPALTAAGARVGDLLFICRYAGATDLDLRIVQRSLPGPTPADQRIADELGLHKAIGSLNDVAAALSVAHDGVPAATVWRDVQKALKVRPTLDLGALLAERFPEFAAPPAEAAVATADSAGDTAAA